MGTIVMNMEYFKEGGWKAEEGKGSLRLMQ